MFAPMSASRPDDAPLGGSSLQFVFKVASRCNLNCSYCYVYNKGDSSWRSRPTFMPDEVFDAGLERIHDWCLSTGQPRVDILFHGGEPLLVGPERLHNWCARATEGLRGVAQTTFSLQTNATLINEDWITVFLMHDIQIGISMDGTREIHNRSRVDHAGRGSYEQVLRGIGSMRAAGLPVSILCVLPFGEDGATTQRHFTELGASRVSYLFPDFTHDTIASVRQRWGPTPCADFLVPAFDCWWTEGTMATLVEPFLSIAQLIMGGDASLDVFGNRPFGYIFVEADGAIEGLDVLRICGHGTASTGLNVLRHGFHQIADASPLHRQAIFTGLPVPAGCATCRERNTCTGGYLPHRWSRARAFDNPSVWCADLLRLFDHIRLRLDVSPEETELRKQVLEELALEVNARQLGSPM